MTTKLETSLTRVLSTVRDLTIHEPTDAQRRARSNFWTHWASTDTPVPATVDLALAARFGGNPAISNWWSLPGFQDWFLNREDFKQRMEFLSELCLDELQVIIRSKVTTAGEKLKAIQLVMSAADKMPRKQEDASKMLDQKIAAMNQAQLLDFISRGMQSVIDVTPPKDS